MSASVSVFTLYYSLIAIAHHYASGTARPDDTLTLLRQPRGSSGISTGLAAPSTDTISGGKSQDLTMAFIHDLKVNLLSYHEQRWLLIPTVLPGHLRR